MRILELGAILFSFSFAALAAQYSERLDSCMDKARTQHAMHVCASEEAGRVDAELNDIYRILVSAAAKHEDAVAKIPFAKRQDAVAKIGVAEKAWVAYRDAYIEAMYPAENKQTVYGSIFPMEVNLLRARLTRQHIEALKELLDRYSKTEQQE